jgi:hypothetical protein
VNQPTLHTGLEYLLEESRVKIQFPDVVYSAAYHPGVQDVRGRGLELLVKFRLLHPNTPVLFFSFLPLTQLLPKDEFDVLQLPGTEFIQLPCSKETIIQAASKQNAKPHGVHDTAWKTFSERACKSILKKRIGIIKHKQELAFINKVGLGLRLAIGNVMSYPEQRSETMIRFNERYDAMLAYVRNPQIQEILKFGSIVQQSDDAFLTLISTLVKEFLFISDYRNKEKFSELKQAIIKIQDVITILETLQPE